jgi:glycosyltransferase involved in cell wall biosynthesis
MTSTLACLSQAKGWAAAPALAGLKAAARCVDQQERMPLTGSIPRVTLGIATHNRDTYLGAAIDSCLAQEGVEFEVLLVLDGTTNPATDQLLSRYGADSRLRVVRHPANLGIAAAYNTFVREGRGELIAMLGDDDLSLPGRLRRQVAIFDAFPDTGVVHGDAVMIDAEGQPFGAWTSTELTPAALRRSFFRHHNHIVDPTRMVRRGVYETIGAYNNRFPLANDFDFWLRAAHRFRFRHCPGGPLVAVRRHDTNASDERAGRAQEVDDVQRALEAALEYYDLTELVPELDWTLLEPLVAQRRALIRLADLLQRRVLPLPELAGRLRARADALPDAPAPGRISRGRSGRLMITAYGFNDSGGGTTVPRLAAKELARRGWDVTVFHAAVAPTPSRQPYEIVESEEDGVRLIGVHNRPHALFDLGHPGRELDDPMISSAFAAALDRLSPDVVHFHNLHNLGASLLDHAAARGLPAYFSTHNYWLICPRAYLLTGTGSICAGPGDGSACASCVGSRDTMGHERRLGEIRARATRGLQRILAVSEAMAGALISAGYPRDLIDVVRQAMPHEGVVWEKVGRDRRPGRIGERLRVAFVGSAYPHKGPQLLVQAAQQCEAEIEVRILGEVPERFAAELRSMDRRGVVEVHGRYGPGELAALLAEVDAVALPSMWWDCAPLAAAECRAARVPLLVPRLGGLPEAIRDGIDGLTFDGLDATDLAAVLDRLAAEPGLLERLQSAIEAPRAFGAYIDELEAYYRGERPEVRPGSPSAPTVRWQGDHGLPSSLAIINDRVTERLPFAVQRITREGVALDPPLPRPADVEVRHQWPPDFSAPPAGRLVVIAPWEFGSIPRAWVAPLQSEVDELWVPSEYVRRMYLEAGVDPERVVVIPNGVDLELFRPTATGSSGRVRFLFVGGVIARKGPDVLLEAFTQAFAGRDDVELVVKDFGAGGVYRDGDRSAIRAWADSQRLPLVSLIDDELTCTQLADLYRSCDVLVHPYRAEGFAMPVLEAMACGLPVIVTDGGPTDEFCPPEAGWRIASHRVAFAANRIDTIDTVGRPWALEPSLENLVELLGLAAAGGEERRARGAAGRAAALRLSWDAVAQRYAERLRQLSRAAQPRLRERTTTPFAFTEDVALRVLATPAWRTEDRLAELLRQWGAKTARTTSACLYLLADPDVDGEPAQLEARVLAAAVAASLDLDDCADVNVLMEPMRPHRDRGLHAAVDVYVPLHAACAGHLRLAREAGNRVLAPEAGELGNMLGALQAGSHLAA